MPILDTIEQFEKGYYGRSLTADDRLTGPTPDFWNIPARPWMAEEAAAPPPTDTGRGFFSGLAEGFGKTKGSELIPFIGAGVEAKGLYDLYESAKRVEAGNPTDEDVQKLKTVYDENTKQRGRAESIGYTTARILSQLPAFAGELMATSGLYYAGRKIGQEAALKAIGSVIDDAAEKAAARLASRVVGGAVGAAYQTIPATAPRIVGGTIERQTPRIAFDAEQKPVVTAPGEDFATAAVKSLGDQFIELLSERSGGMILQGLGKVPGVGALAGLQKAIADRWIRKTGGTFDQLLDTVQRGAGWHGVIGEILEERAGEVGRAALGIESYRPPTTDQLIAEAIAFSVPGAARAGISQASRIFERPQAAPPPRERTSYAVQKSQAEATAPVETPATLPQVGQEVRQEDQAQKEAPPVTTPLPGLESPAPPRVQPEVTPPPVAESSPSQAPRGSAAPVIPEPVAPIQEAPPPVPAPPPPVRTAAPDPVVRDLVGFLDIENPKLPRDTAFVHELPNPENKAELLPLAEIAKQPGGDTYLAQKATENAIKKATNSRKLSRKFIFLRHRETGEIRLAQIWKDQRKNFKILDPETGSGDGLEARTIIGPTGKWDPLSYMRLTVVSPELNQAITPEQYRAISDQAVEKTGGRFERPEGVAQVTRAATESQVSESESGLTNEQLQDWFEAVRDWRGKELNEEFLKQHIDLLQSAAATLDWESSRLIKSLKQSFKKKPKTFDEFFEAFDPVGYDRRQSERRRGVGGLRGPSAPARAAEAPPTRQVGATPPTVPPAAAPAPAPTPAAAPQPAPTITSVNQLLAVLPEFSPEQQELVDGLLSLGIGNVPVQIVGNLVGRDGKPALGTFSPNENIIRLDPSLLAEPGVAQRVALHEMVHAALYRAMHGEFADTELAARAEALNSQLQQLFQEARGIAGDQYGVTNEDEFVAEALSNPDFQAVLGAQSNIDVPGGRSIFRRFLDAVLEFFGFGRGSILEQVIRVAGGLAELNPQAQLTTQEAPLAMVGGPQVFRTPAQRAEALATPGLTPEQIAENEAIANVQASIVPAHIAGRIFMGSKDRRTEEGLANQMLNFLAELRLVGISPQHLSTMPRGTEQEIRASEVGAGALLAQAEIIEERQARFEKTLLRKVEEYLKALGGLKKASPLAFRELALKGMIDGLISDYRTYLANQTAVAGKARNVDAAFIDMVNRLAGVTDAFGKNHGGLVKAMTVIAQNIPPSILAGGNNLAVISWAKTSGVLNGQVSADIITYLLDQKGPNLPPALETNRRLVPTLAALRDLEDAKIDAAAEIAHWESVFAGFKPSATRKVSPRAFAQRYFQWESERRKVAEILRAASGRVDRLDLEVRALARAIDELQQLHDHPDYRNNVTLALDYANVIANDLMNRDPETGAITYTGPISGDKFVVKLELDKATEQDNMQKLARLAHEIEAFLAVPGISPLDQRKWSQRLEVIQKFMLQPWFSPEFGLDRSWIVAFESGDLKLNPDVMDFFRRKITADRLSSPQATAQYIGGRAADEVLREMMFSDKVEQAIKQLHSDSDHGWAAITNKVDAAAKAHGFRPEEAWLWSELVAEPIIASQQNTLTPYLTAGKFTVSGIQVMPEDIVAVQAMKKWTNRILEVVQRTVKDTTMAVKTKDTFLDANILRNALGSGQLIMPRGFSLWAAGEHGFAVRWRDAANDAARLALLADEENFRRAVLGRIVEMNPEYNRKKSEQWRFYEEMARDIRDGTLTFSDVDQVLDHLAQLRSASSGLNSALERNEAARILLKDINEDVAAFNSATEQREEVPQVTGVPEPVVRVATANNEFTKPRIKLVAPSSYYSYSLARDVRRAGHLASLKAFLQLRQLEKWGYLENALEAEKDKYDQRIKSMGYTRAATTGKATKAQKIAAHKAKLSGEVRFDYNDVVDALRTVSYQKAQLTRLAIEEAEHVDHPAISLFHHVGGVMPKMLLATPTAITKNTLGATFAAPIIINRTLGLNTIGVFDLVPATGRFIRSAYQATLAAVFNRIPALEQLIKSNPPLRLVLGGFVNSADHWRQLYMEGIRRGIVAPYDIKQRVQMLSTRRGVGGRIEDTPRGLLTRIINTAFNAPGVVHISEGLSYLVPKWFDDFANISNMEWFERVLDKLKIKAHKAYEGRQAAAAASGANWRDLSDADNLLTPEELGIVSHAGMKYFRDLFAAEGGLDHILLRWYDRASAAPSPAAVPLLEPEEEASVYLEYAKMTNLPTTSNRPLLFKGGGASGDMRRVMFMFGGYPAAFSEQLSKLFHLHSKDSRWIAAVGVLGISLVALLIGALAHEGGEEFKELLTGEVGGRIRLANIAHPIDALRYSAISFANIIPYVGEPITRAFGATTHRANLMELSSLIPMAGLIKEGVEALQKTIQTGDPVYPITDFAKRWFFPARMALNRVPGLAGDVQARNAARAYTAALPPDQEARLTGGGAIRQTPVTPIIRSLLAAAYSGDQAGVELAFRNAVEERKALGDPDPERSVIASIQGRVPARTVLGRLPTESEEARTVARMNEDQRAAYMQSKDAMGLISQVTGKEIRTTAQEPMSLVQRRGLGRSRSGGRGLRLRTPRLRLRRVSLRSRRRGRRRVRGRTLRKRLV